jgi:hypothetical protein
MLLMPDKAETRPLNHNLAMIYVISQQSQLHHDNYCTLASCKSKYLTLAKSFKPLKVAPTCTNETVLKNTEVLN